MKIWKVIVANLCAIVIIFAVCYGIMMADRGSKKVGGYFENNTLVSFSVDKEYYCITLLNEEFKIRRY